MITWLTIEGDGLVRVFVAGLVLMGACASLLGVLLGWKLRNREVAILHRRINILQIQLSRAAGKGRVAMVQGRYMGKSKVEEMIRKGDLVLDEDIAVDLGDAAEECGARYSGPAEDCRWMKCSKPSGHQFDPKTRQHGYAGVFWG